MAQPPVILRLTPKEALMLRYLATKGFGHMTEEYLNIKSVPLKNAAEPEYDRYARLVNKLVERI